MMHYPIMRLEIRAEMEEALVRVLRSGWIMQGPEVEAFEREFAAYVGARHACAVSSGTAALHLALQSLDLGEGAEVITVSHSFIATANAVRFCGGTPVFVDIDPATFNLRPELMAEVITAKTRAILCVHQMGMPCDLSGVLDVAQRYDLPVIEDAACAIGSEILWQGQWQKIGRPHGVAAAFSFHPRKVLTTGEGGMITTNDPVLDHRMRMARQHGFPGTRLSGPDGFTSEGYGSVGFNYRLTDLQASLGRIQLQRLDSTIQQRRLLAARYTQRFTEWGAVQFPLEPEWARSNWQSYCVRLPDGCSQAEAMRRLEGLGIATRRGILCAHREAAYQKGGWKCAGKMQDGPSISGACEALRESERAQERCISLPLYPQLSVEDIDTIAKAVVGAVQ